MITQNPFQINLPVFVKTPFTAQNRQWKHDEHFAWLELGMDPNKVHRLFVQGYIKHDDNLAAEIRVGDGLENLEIGALQDIVDSINKKVKEHTKNESEYKKKKCPQSKIADKQRGHIRRWRSLYGEMESR